MSSMKKLNMQGALNALLIPLILAGVLFVAAASFGIWAFMSREDYKNNVDQKISVAVGVAEQQTASEKDNEFAEKEKLPLQEYAGPAAYGSVVVKYPKTWSAYVSEKTGGTPIDGYFNPSVVPGTEGNPNYALRMQVLNTSYTQEIKKYDSQVKAGKLKASPYIPAKVQTVTGMRFDGEVVNGKTGSMVIVPMRDKTLKLWTESNNYLGDFNNIILPNYTFSE
jgi:hypothetical protein